MKWILCMTLVSLAVCAIAQERKHSLTGNIQHWEKFESKILGNKRDIWIYLPPDYDKELERRYPVLYMHDGQNVFDGFTSFIPNEEWKADEAAEALIQSKLIEPLIIVAISNGGAERSNEYLPTKWSPDGELPARKEGDRKAPAYGGKADLYGKMLIDEIMPAVNAKFRTKTGVENTGIAGSSFGGVVSLHLGLTRPDVFGKLGIFSPSLWWDHALMIRRTQEFKGDLKAKVWIDGGTLNDLRPTELFQLRDALEGKGLKLGDTLACYLDGYAQHNERAWQNRFPAFLMFMYGSQSRR